MIPTLMREMVRYGAKGALTTLANIALMAALVEMLATPPPIAAAISTATLLVLGYQLMNHFVFPGGDTPESTRAHLRRGASYYGVILSGKGVNYVLFLGMLQVGVPYPLSWFFGACIVFLGTFSANRYLWTDHSVA